MPFITSLSASSLMGRACKWNVSVLYATQTVSACMPLNGGSKRWLKVVGGGGGGCVRLAALCTFHSHVGPHSHCPVN